MIRSILLAALCLFLLSAATPNSVAGQRPSRQTVDVALVLAADISGSTTNQEIRLQRSAYVTALRDPRVVSAIQLGHHGRIAVAYVEWSRRSLQIPVMPFRVIGTAEEAAEAQQQLAAWIDSRAGLQRPHGGGTGIGSALDFAHQLLAASAFQDVPWVIDISGDGINDDGTPPDRPRDRLVSSGAVVNGLPIAADLSSTESDALQRYYARCVIGGTGAFQLVVTDATRLAETLTLKLVMEIAGLAPPEVQEAGIVLASESPTGTADAPC